MSLLTYDEIQELLQEQYDKNCEKYGASHILGSCVTGLANYNLAETAAEVRTVTVYLPTFEELCMTRPIKQELDNHMIIDIRFYYSAMQADVEKGLELLFSSNYVLNPIYAELLKNTLIKNNDQIAHYNPHKRLANAYQCAVAAKLAGNDLEVARLWLAATLYKEGQDLYTCFRPDKDFYKQYLLGVKHGVMDIDADNLCAEIQDMANKTGNVTDIAAEAQLKDGILTIMGRALHQTVDSTAFINSLTFVECQAIHYAKEYMENGTGYWNVSKLSRTTPISRAVYSNVIRKFEVSKVAKATPSGAHGIKIELYDPTIIEQVEDKLNKKK